MEGVKEALGRRPGGDLGRPKGGENLELLGGLKEVKPGAFGGLKEVKPGPKGGETWSSWGGLKEVKPGALGGA